ncbi:MAG: hypothetical protein DMG57_37905 [Acidobacteria bacterium]|nr:MAG: hypothetical protein DMG57_37905 [Acidobacteriota bacterium]
MWRWVFSSSRTTPVSPAPLLSTFRQVPSGLFSLLFPEARRICHRSLTDITRVPVRSRGMRAPEPLAAEYYCVTCRTPFHNRFPLDADGCCRLCRSSIRGFDAASCFGTYEGTLRPLIHLFKYSRMKPLVKPLAEYLAAALPRDQRFDIAVPMPLHWRRRWQRGNQSELLARATASRSGIPMANAVRRMRATESQAGLSNAQRRANVSGAFRVKGGRQVQGLRVLLIDDVMTTGATAAACAQALKRAGAKSVALLALARVDRRLAEVPAGESSHREVA